MSESLRSKESDRNKTEAAPVESQMVINPQGARIEKLSLGEYLIFRSIVRGDGKSASSHPCTPIFGPETMTSYGLPQHGPMRNELCEVEENSPNRVVLNYDINTGEYPQGMKVTQVFSLQGRSFTLETTHANNGNQQAPVNFGEHFYWVSPRNWEGLTINDEDVTGAVKNDLVVPLQARNRIAIPGLPEIILEQKGLPVANLWVYHDETSGKYDRNYVCIEPVEGDPTKSFFGSPESLIAPGTSRSNSLTISINS